VIPKATGVLIVALLALSGSGRPAEAVKAEGLDSKSETGQIRAMLAIARKGTATQEQVKKIVALMSESAKGKRLSRWCYYALLSVGSAGDERLKRYMRTADWTSREGLARNEVRVRHGPPPKEPALPADLLEDSNRAWKACIQAVFDSWRNADAKDYRTRSSCRWHLIRTAAPSRLVLSLMTGALKGNASSTAVKCAAAEVAAVHGFRIKTDVKELYGLLEDKDAKLRAGGARALSRLYYDNCPSLPPRHPVPRKALDALVKATGDADLSVRCEATYGIRWLGYQARPAVPALIARFEKEDTERHRYALLSALSFIGGREDAGTVILKTIKSHPSVETRRAAAVAVGWLASHLKQRKQDADYAALAREAVPLLIAQFRNDAKMAWRLPVALSRFDEHAAPAVAFLHQRMKTTTNKTAKDRCLFALGRIGPAAKAAVPDVLKCMAFHKMRFLVSIVLGRIGVGGKDVEKALLELLKSRENHIRREAAESMGRVAEESAEVIAALEALSKDKDPDVREQARKAIATIRDRARARKQPEEF
jgi:HEAT repeat protein